MSTKMKELFDLVRDANDWRAPICAFVTPRQLAERGASLDDVCDAITFYTATSAHTREVPAADGMARGWYVTSIGYRAGPAGP